VDNSFLSSRTLSLDLPDEVIARLIEKENRLAAQSVAVAEPSGETSSGIPWGSAAIVVGVVAAGVLTARYVRNKRKDRSSLAILSIFPNPTPGAVTVKLNKNISGVTGTLTVTNESGQVVHSVPAISGTSIETDLSHLEQGSYFFSVQSGGETTAAQAVIVAR
ncbi:MAG TPA: T9SS type A sorting domain-containing protein, partial [Bacteroidia bacterium]|nr:T9SS type A sorting domain-containing protein [Bacteroidia bacterium]